MQFILVQSKGKKFREFHGALHFQIIDTTTSPKSGHGVWCVWPGPNLPCAIWTIWPWAPRFFDLLAGPRGRAASERAQRTTNWQNFAPPAVKNFVPAGVNHKIAPSDGNDCQKFRLWRLKTWKFSSLAVKLSKNLPPAVKFFKEAPGKIWPRVPHTHNPGLGVASCSVGVCFPFCLPTSLFTSQRELQELNNISKTAKTQEGKNLHTWVEETNCSD